MEAFADVDAYLKASERWPAEIKALRPLLLETGLTEEIKWGKPCYSHDDANVVLIQEFSGHLALMFFKGVLLDDQEDVLHDEQAGTELPARPDEELAPELADRLASHDELAEAFNDLTPGRQREYNLHVSDAKHSATRERRVDKIVPRILDGKGLRDR